MGINTDPTLDDYSEEDCGCFKTGKTPLTLMISFAGITKNPLMGLPLTPNRTIFLTQQESPCFYRWEDWPEYCNLLIGPDNTGINYQRFPDIEYFISLIEKPCMWSHLNGITDDANPFYRGAAQIAWVEPTYCPSLAGIEEQLVIPREDEMNAEFWPYDDKSFVARFASHSRNTNIRIKFDWEHFAQYNMLDR